MTDSMFEKFRITNCCVCGTSDKCLAKQIETSFERYTTFYFCEDCYNEKMREEIEQNAEMLSMRRLDTRNNGNVR